MSRYALVAMNFVLGANVQFLRISLDAWHTREPCHGVGGEGAAAGGTGNDSPASDARFCVVASKTALN